MNPKLSVIGLGKLGLPTAGVFAASGYETIGYDASERVREYVRDRVAYISEPGLDDLYEKAGSKLRVVDSTYEAVMQSDVTFIIVPTPSQDTGWFDACYVHDALGEIITALREKNSYHLVVVVSTVMPGTMNTEFMPRLLSLGDPGRQNWGLCYNPEFVALGSVIRDFRNPDIVLIGESDAYSGRLLQDIYENVSPRAEIKRMNFVNAELTKLMINTYLTTKVTFANTVAKFCEVLPGAHVDVVTNAVGADTRIGRKYLTGATATGGTCLPRDVRATMALARTYGNDTGKLPNVVNNCNESEVYRLVRLVRKHTPIGGMVGVLGLSYKPKTDVIKESVSIAVIKSLYSEHDICAYDPAAMDNARRELAHFDDRIRFCDNMVDCIEQSDTLLIATRWHEFEGIEGFFKDQTIIDVWRLLNPDLIAEGNRLVQIGVYPA